MLSIVRAAVDGASASRALLRALTSADLASFLSRPLRIVAVGKAASAMAGAAATCTGLRLQSILAVGTHRDSAMPAGVEWFESAHPVPDARSLAAAEQAVAIASAMEGGECLVLLLSGGASALMALPIAGLTLDDKQHTIRTMMLAGADIHALNTVRKHLSSVKGGRLAALCPGVTLTLAVSDVVGDDPSVIGSGPGVPDPTTWTDAALAFERFGGPSHRAAVREMIRRGVAGEIAETPKAGDPRLAHSHVAVIASRRYALDAAAAAARQMGYTVVTLDGDIVGEAREAAVRWLDQVEAVLETGRQPICVLSAGETTVRVTGAGRGGRNQEFALALVQGTAGVGRGVMLASIGTDGIDGPTDAAGALVDATSHERATALGLDPEACLLDNNSYDFFALLGDLIHLGRTDTNVGDIQILLAP